MKSKRIFTLMLALVMTLSLMTVANAFNDDKDIERFIERFTKRS